MRRLRNALIGAAALAALLALVVATAGPWWLRRAVTPERVAAEASDALGREVTVAAVSLHFAPLPRLRLDGVAVGPPLRRADADRVADPGDDGDPDPAVRLERLDVTLAASGLLRGRVAPGRIRVAGGAVALERGADGRVALRGEAAGGGREAAWPALPGGMAPAVEIADVRIDLEDRARGPEAIATRAWLDSLSVEPDWREPELALAGAVRLEREGRSGRLHWKGRLRPGSAGGPPQMHVTAAADDLDAELLLPYLPARLGLAVAQAALEGELRASGWPATGTEIQLAVRLPTAGRVRSGDLALSQGCALDLRATWLPGRDPRLDGRLRAERVSLGAREAHDLDLSFRSEAGVLSVSSLEVDAFRGGVALGADGAAGPLHFDMDADGNARVRLTGTEQGDGLLFGLDRIEAGDLALSVSSPTGARLPVRIGSLRVSGLRPGAPAVAIAEAVLGSGGAGGSLRLHVTTEPLPADPDLDALALDVALQADRIDPTPLLAFVPAELRAESEGARWNGEATLRGSAGVGLRGEAGLRLSAGRLSIGGLDVDAPLRLHGELRVDGAGVSTPAATVEAARASLGGHSGRDVRGELSYADGVVAVSSVELHRYEGVLDPGVALERAPELGLDVPRAERIDFHGEPRPLPFGGAPWLRAPARVSLRGVDAVLRDRSGAFAGDLPVRVASAEIAREGPAEAPDTTVVLEASLGADGERGSLALDGVLVSSVAAGSAVTGRLTARGLDPSLVLPYLPGSPDGRDVTGPLDVEIGADAGEPAGSLRVTLPDGEVRLGRLRIGPGVLDARWALRDGEVALTDAAWDADWAAVDERRGEALAARFALERSVLVLRSATLRAHAGTLRSEGRVAWSDAGPARFDGTLAVEDVAAESLFGQPLPEEPVRMRGEARVAGPLGGEDAVDAWEGEGELRLTGGRIPTRRLFEALWKAIVTELPGVPPAAKNGEAPRVPLEEAAVPFRLEAGRVTSDAVRVVTADYTFAGRGSLDREGRIQLRGELGLTTLGIHSLLRLGALSPLLGRALRLPAIPLQVDGALPDPRFQPDVARIPLTALREIVGLPGRATDAVRGAGEAVLDAGRRTFDRMPLRGRRSPEPSSEPGPPTGAGEPAAGEGAPAGQPTAPGEPAPEPEAAAGEGGSEGRPAAPGGALEPPPAPGEAETEPPAR